MYFVELKLAVSLAVLPSTESLRIVIISLIVPYLSLSITMDRKKIIMLFSYRNVMEVGLKLEWEIFLPYILLWDIYKFLQSLLASKNIIEHPSPTSLRFSTTMDTKVNYQTSATLNQSELQFKSSVNARKLLDRILLMINEPNHKFYVLMRVCCGHNP